MQVFGELLYNINNMTKERDSNKTAATETVAPKVSIVVPIYNVEKYLRECVDSILAQTLKEIEVILVDDGSPDKCGEIIDEYAKKDKRVIALHQQNSGYSKAVNNGIRKATGEYVGIIESDDWIEPDMYERLYGSAHKYGTDLTKGMFYFYNPTLSPNKQNVVYRNPNGIDLMYAPNKAFEVTEWPTIVGFHASIWSSIYKREFIKEIMLPETAGASYQDFPFMIDAMTKAKKISVVKKAFVHWRNEPKQGNSTSARGKKLLLMGKNTETGLEILKKSGKYDALKEAFFVHALWTNIGFFFRIDKKYKKEYFDILHRIFLNIKDDDSFKYIYFRPEDIQCAKALMNDNLSAFKRSWYLGGIKRKGYKLLLKLFPGWNAAFYAREQVEELRKQNMMLAEEIAELQEKAN